MFADTSTHGGLIEGPTTGYLRANDPSPLIGVGALAIAQVNCKWGGMPKRPNNFSRGLEQLMDNSPYHLFQGYVTAEGFPSQPGSSGYEQFVTKPPSYQG